MHTLIAVASSDDVFYAALVTLAFVIAWQTLAAAYIIRPLFHRHKWITKATIINRATGHTINMQGCANCPARNMVPGETYNADTED